MTPERAKRKPALSGFCNPGNPPESHDRCRLEGCPCPHHTPAERVKVPLACLQGRHTPTCGHLRSDLPGPHGNASTVTLEEALAMRDPALDTPLAEEYAAKVDAPATRALEHVSPDDPTVIEEQTALLDGTIHRTGVELGIAPRPHPDGAVNCAYSRNLEGDLECEHGCGRTLAEGGSVTITGPAPSWLAKGDPLTDLAAARDAVEAEDGFTPDPVELTLEERRQVIAAHMILDPQAALDTVAAIVTARTAAAGTVAP